jgi:hypothetical protein
MGSGKVEDAPAQCGVGLSSALECDYRIGSGAA